MTTIASNIAELHDRIAKACVRCGREHNPPRILAVSKRQPCTKITQAYEAGLHHFGENYLQEALPKINALSKLPLHWHFIGPIQSNKTRPIAEAFDWVHSVDRLKIAQRLNEQRPNHLPPLNVCIQVNISGEATKSGISAEESVNLASKFSDFPRLTLRGIMVIPKSTENTKLQREQFMSAKQLFDQLKPIATIDTLSMGMSADLESAIYAHSNLLRIGTSLFGTRES